MAIPGARQIQLLSQVFPDVLTALRREILVVLGCATGNGFEHIDPAVTRRAVGVDIKPRHIEALSGRFGHRLPGLELVCAEVLDLDFAECSSDLIHWAVIYSRRRLLALWGGRSTPRMIPYPAKSYARKTLGCVDSDTGRAS